MNFLNPFILFGLGAAVLPVLIHLLSKRKTKELAFPSIEFLDLMKSNRIRSLKLKQLLVMLLRTLIIIMVILAFARPAVNSVFYRNARSSVVVIIDGSASMEYIHNGEALYRQALRKAGEIITMLGKDDTAAIIVSASLPILIEPGMTTDKQKLLNALNSVEYLWSSSDVTGSFDMALDMLSSSAVPNRELYFITDGAENALPDSLPSVPYSLRIYTVLLGSEKRQGAIIEQVNLVDRLVSPGKELTFDVEGVLTSDDEETGIEFFINDERKGRIQVVKHSDESIETEITYTPDTPGLYSVYAAVDDGRFEAGEIRRIVVHVPLKIKVLLVGDSESGWYYLLRALEPDSEESMFLIKKVLSTELVQSDFTQADVIVLSGVSALQEQDYNSLLSAVVERGKGLVVFPPADMNTSFYFQGIFRDMVPVEIEKRMSIDGKSGNFAVIDWFDMTHPILDGVSKEGKFQKPEVRSFFKMRPTGKVTALARFNDGSMAIGNTVCGKGRIVVFAVDSSPSDSELPLTGIFVPLFIRTVQYLSGTDIICGRYETGDSMNEFIGDVPQSTSVAIKHVNGPARFVDVTPTDEGMFLRKESAGEPGFYSVFVGDEERTRFCVNAPRAEIIFKRAPIHEYAEVYNRFNWKVLKENESVSESVTKDRYGTELFGLFMLLSGALLVIEMVVSRKA